MDFVKHMVQVKQYSNVPCNRQHYCAVAAFNWHILTTQAQYKQGYFDPRLNTLKVLKCCFLSNLQIDMDLGFLKSYYIYIIMLKRLQNCDLSNLEAKKKLPSATPVCYLSKKGFDSIQARIFFLTSTFDRSQFCSTLSYKDEQ